MISSGKKHMAIRRILKETFLKKFGQNIFNCLAVDMQMLCNIFPILSLQLMKRSTFKQFLILKKNIIYGMTVNEA